MRLSALLTIATLLTLAATLPSFWPLPNKYTHGNASLSVNPCNINYKVSVSPSYLREIVDIYLATAFKCSKSNPSIHIRQELTDTPVTLNVFIKNSSLIPPYAGYQNFTLDITEDGNWQLRADFFPGYLRGFETFSQLFTPQAGTASYVVDGLPLTVTDYPTFQWRGLMIDTARHFLPVADIKSTIDSLMFSKMNVLHWHISDEDSFPVVLDSHPELAQYGSFKNQTYSKTDLKEIVQYALRRGVRVVPEIDTPAHTQAWGRSPQLANITLNCNKEYEGQFDPTLDLTYTVVTDVLKELDQIFIDPVFHMGGDEVVQPCWDQRPAIKEFMKAQNISTYQDLSIYFRKRQRSIFKSFSAKDPSYWANEDINLPTEPTDYIHWWGVSKNVQQVSSRANRIILANYDQAYLDVGYGGRAGAGYGSSIITWRQVYGFNPVLTNIRGKIVGGEVCLWSEVSNRNTHFRKIWPRAAVMGERLWNPNVNTTSFRDIVRRLVDHATRLRVRGFPSSPVTVQLCEKNPSLCFA